MSERRRKARVRRAPRAYMQNSANSAPFSTIQRASSRAPRAFEAADITCEQAAKEGTQIGARSKEHGACEARCTKEISAPVRPNGLVQKLTLGAKSAPTMRPKHVPSSTKRERRKRSRW